MSRFVVEKNFVQIVACLLAALMFMGVVVLGTSPPPTVLLLIHQDIYSDIRQNVIIFENDLKNEGYLVLKETVDNLASPPEIKERIRSYYNSYALEGCILIGNIKAAYFESHFGDLTNPEALEIDIALQAADMYYMDVDGEWEHVSNPDFCQDAPLNVATCYKRPSCETFRNEYIVGWGKETEWNYSIVNNKTQYNIEIWVSRIMGHNLRVPGKTETDIINNYLEWNHRYRNGTTIADKVYILCHSPGYNEQDMDYSGVFSEIIKKDNVTKSEFSNYLEDPQGSKLLYLTAHSCPQGHMWSDEFLGVDELLNLHKNSLFYLLNACSSCRWDQYVSTPESPNYLGGVYTFAKTHPNGDYGLCTIGFTGVGGFNWLEYFTDYLDSSSGGSYGAAFEYWVNRNLIHNFAIWNYVLLGDPTIQATPKSTNTEIVLNLFDPEYGENGSVTITGYVGPPEAHVTRLSWDWGDGTVAESWFAATHQYRANGSYTVRVTAYTDSGNSKTATKDVTVTTVSPNGPGSSAHTYGAVPGWYMVSVPLNSGTALDLFGTTAYRWNPAAGQYDILATIEPAKGYWVNLSSSKTVTDSGSKVTSDVTIDISTADWHQISTPWLYPKASIQVTKAGLTQSWNAATAAGWVRDQIYGYKATDGEYTTPTTLDPWYGYWVRADVSGLSLKLLYAAGTSVIPPPPPLAFAPMDLPSLPGSTLTAPLPGNLEFTNIPNPITDVHTTTFVVKGPMAALVEAIKVQIFDLSGRLVYEEEEAGTSMEWHTENQVGETLTNGVYLYRMYALIGEEWVESEVKKLAILR